MNYKTRCCPAVSQAVSSPPVLPFEPLQTLLFFSLPVPPPCLTPPICAPPSAACCRGEMGHLQHLQCPIQSLLPLVLTSSDPQANRLLRFQFFFSFFLFFFSLDPF